MIFSSDRASAHGVMGPWIDLSSWTHSASAPPTKAMVCVILYPVCGMVHLNKSLASNEKEFIMWLWQQVSSVAIHITLYHMTDVI